MATSGIKWSEWFNFDKEEISKVPQTPGVFRMHAAMKILYIGNTENLQKRLFETMEDDCTKKASRFCYFETESSKQLKDEILKEYLEKHDGKLPKCMENKK